jgi:hypothetical protein
VISNSPQLENSSSNECFGRLIYAGFFDLVGGRGCVRWWVVVLKTGNMDVAAIVWMLPPSEVHSLRICVVKFVVCMYCPLDIESSSVGSAEAIVERNFENVGVEVVV